MEQLTDQFAPPVCSLSRLWETLKGDFDRHGFFQSGSLPGDNNRQRGVVRVNCIDCLDRTNVVQGLLGRKHLEYVLDRAGLLDATDMLALPNTFPQAGFPSLSPLCLVLKLKSVTTHCSVWL